MSNFWHKIDDRQFEELAVAYAETVFPKWRWKNTKQTHDGGKDGWSEIFSEQTEIGLIRKEAWVEAKYSKNTNHALPLSRVASTVLIGHNQKELVQLLLIVTNASFSESTMYEINVALGKRVSLVTGEELKAWLFDDKQKNIRDNYFPNEQIDYNNNAFSLIGKPLIIRHDFLCKAVSANTERLILGDEYTLFFTLNIPIHFSEELKFEITNHSNLITIPDDFLLETRKGTNFISIPFIASRQGKITRKETLVAFKEIFSSVQLNIKLALTIQSSSRIEVFCKSQSECGNTLLRNYNSFCNREQGVFFNLIEGEAGNGKSRVLIDFLRDKRDKEYIFLKFNQKNELSNSSLLIRLLTFIVWGKFFAENILYNDEPKELKEEIEQLHRISGYNKNYTEYLQYIADENNAFEIINKLTGKPDLLPPISNAVEKIVILDDLQFLGNKTAQFLLYLLEQKNLSDYKIFFIFTKRGQELTLDELNEFVKTYSAQEPLKISISENDVYQSLELNNLQNFPSSIFSKLNKNFLILKEFIAEALAAYDKKPIAILNNEVVKKLLSENEKTPFVYNKFNKEQKKIIDIVFFFQTGIEASYLYDRFSDKAIDSLIYGNIIKNSSTGYVPYHDLIWESVLKTIRYDSEHIYNYAIQKKQNGYMIEYLSILIFFPSKFDREKDFFMSQISSLHNAQKYSSTYYILHRFFSIHHHEKILYDRYDKALLLFYYAYATFNVGNKNGLEYFEKAYNLLERLPQLEDEQSLSNLILSEIANCHYWNFDFKSVTQKYKKISTYFQTNKNRKKDAWVSYFTISNRYINMLHFMDKNEAARNIYEDIVVQIADKKEIERLAIYIFNDYNQVNFVNDPQYSYDNMKKIMEAHFENIPIKNQFILKSTFLIMGIFLGHNKIEELEQWIEWGKTNSLEYNYRVAKLDLAACYAFMGKFDQVDRTIHSVIDIRDFPMLALGKYYNLDAIVYLYKQKYNLALASLNAQEQCFAQLGRSYIDRIHSNKRLVQSMPTHFKVSYTSLISTAFYIEIRL